MKNLLKSLLEPFRVELKGKRKLYYAYFAFGMFSVFIQPLLLIGQSDLVDTHLIPGLSLEEATLFGNLSMVSGTALIIFAGFRLNRILNREDQ